MSTLATRDLRLRTADSQQVVRWLLRAQRGENVVVLVSAPFGFGKSTLIRGAAHEARERGFRVGTLALAEPVVTLADDGNGHAAETPAVSLDEVVRQARLGAERWLLCLDDAHLAQPDVIASIARKVGGARGGIVLLLAAPADAGGHAGARAAELHASLWTTGSAETYVLSPWSGADVNQHLEPSLGAGASLRFGYELARITGGSPALLQAYLDAIESLSPGERGPWLLGARRLIDLPLPEAACQFVEARTESVGGATRRVLQALAIIEMFVDAQSLAGLVNTTEDAVEAALDELEESRLVRARPTTDGLAFAVWSPVAARVISRRAPSSFTHRVGTWASGQFLGRDLAPGDAVVRALHHAQVSPLDRLRAHEILEAVDLLLSRGRHLAARDLAEIVIAKTSEDQLRGDDLVRATQLLAQALGLSGETAAAERLVDAMRRHRVSDPRDYLGALLNLARGWLSSGRELEGEAALRHLVVHPQSSRDVHADATTELVRLHHRNGRPERAVALAAMGRERHRGESGPLARLWLHQSIISEMAGQPDLALNEGWQALRLARCAGDQATAGRAMATIGESRLDTDSTDRAVLWLRSAVRRVERHQLIGDAAWIRNRLVPAYLEAGAWEVAARSARRAVGQATSLNLPYTRRRHEAAMALVDALEGRLSESWLHTRLTASDFGNPVALVSVAVALFEQQQLAGHDEHARTTIALTAEVLESRPGWERLTAVEVLPRLVRSLQEAHDLTGLREAVGRLAAIADSRPSLLIGGTEALVARARLALIEERYEDAIGFITEARERYGTQKYRWRWAASASVAAEAHAAVGEHAQAVRALQAAIAVLDGLGAAPAAAHQRAEVHALGASAPRIRRAEGILTQRQAEVARLAAEGLPDRQIAAELGVSPRTVTTHMHTILQRLELHSRNDLAAWLEREGTAIRPYGTGFALLSRRTPIEDAGA